MSGNEITSGIWELSGRLAMRVSGLAEAPLALETELNGGRNPQGARYYADVILGGPALPENARILDMGSGYGRIARELAASLGTSQRYFGLDPHPKAVRWATANISARHPNVTFERIDLHSVVYNRRGRLRGADYRFPFADGSLDVVVMTSVLTHVDFDTVRNYVRESARTLKPETGRLITTWFLLDEEVDRLLASGRSHYRMAGRHGVSRVENTTNPERAIAHPRQLVLDLLTESGLGAHSVHEGYWCGREVSGVMDFQDLIIAGRHPECIVRHEWAPQEPTAAESARIAAIADAVAGIGLCRWQQVSSFITWAGQLAVNVIRWEAAHLTLAAGVGADYRPLDLPLNAARLIGLDATASHGRASRFLEVTEGELVSMILARGSHGIPAVLDGLEQIVTLGIAAVRSPSLGLVRRFGGVVPVVLPSVG